MTQKKQLNSLKDLNLKTAVQLDTLLNSEMLIIKGGIRIEDQMMDCDVACGEGCQPGYKNACHNGCAPGGKR